MIPFYNRPPTQDDPWDYFMEAGLSFAQKTVFVITVQGGTQFKGSYDKAFSSEAIIQLREEEGDTRGIAVCMHVIQRTAIIAITTIVVK